MNNEHSKHFEEVKYMYDNEIWKISRVRAAVVKGWITSLEFEEITGISY